MAQATVQLNFRIPAELNDQLEVFSAQSGMSKTQIIKEALEQYLQAKGE